MFPSRCSSVCNLDATVAWPAQHQPDWLFSSSYGCGQSSLCTPCCCHSKTAACHGTACMGFNLLSCSISASGQPGITKPLSPRAASPHGQHSMFLPLPTHCDVYTMLDAALAAWLGRQKGGNCDGFCPSVSKLCEGHRWGCSQRTHAVLCVPYMGSSSTATCIREA